LFLKCYWLGADRVEAYVGHSAYFGVKGYSFTKQIVIYSAFYGFCGFIIWLFVEFVVISF